jgi:hypothetical protein
MWVKRYLDCTPALEAYVSGGLGDFASLSSPSYLPCPRSWIRSITLIYIFMVNRGYIVRPR